MFIRICKMQTACVLVLFILGYMVKIWATTYDVGEGMPYENIGDVPWESLVPGDTSTHSLPSCSVS